MRPSEVMVFLAGHRLGSEFGVNTLGETKPLLRKQID